MADGSRYGYLGDAEVDLESGQVTALVVPGRLRFFGLLGREAEHTFSWAAVHRVGEDIILVEGGGKKAGRSGGRSGKNPQAKQR